MPALQTLVLLTTILAPTAGLLCGECQLLQEVIHRSIMHNISALEKGTGAGTSRTATVEIGQIIWHMCRSDTWKEQRLRPALETVCSDTVKTHVDTFTELWKDKTSEEYHDPALVMRMKRQACTADAVSACSLDELPSDYEPLRPEECPLCHALVGDLFGIIRHSRERPKTGKNDNYFRLIGMMNKACDDLPMRHPIRPKERTDVQELCEEFWDEHEGPLVKLALHRSPAYARSLCSEVLEVCDEPTTIDSLGFEDKDEL